MIPTIKVKPWGQGQGDFVLINEDEFNPDFHEHLDAANKPAKPGAQDGGKPDADADGDGKVTAAELKAALTEKGIAFKGNASKAELQGLLDAANKPADDPQ